MTRPHENIKIAIQRLGRISFRTMLLGTSSSVYGTKKSVTAVLYCKPCMFRSSVKPATLALPTVRFVSTLQLQSSGLLEHLTVASVDERDEIQK